MTKAASSHRVISKNELKSMIRYAKRGVPIKGCTFEHILLLTSDDDLSGVPFINCVFPGTHFQNTTLNGAKFESCDFVQAKFLDSSLRRVDFEDCKTLDVAFEGSDLSDARFDSCDLRDVDFSAARLYRTQFSRMDLRGSRRGRPGRARIKQERDHDWETASQVYRLLKENFLTLANQADASWAHFQEMKMRRRSRNSLSQWLNELIWGYGERPARPFLAGVVIVLIFSFISWRLDLLYGGIEGANSLWHYLLFSAASFVTMSFPGLEATRTGLQLLSTIEAGLGVVTLAMFTFAVGQRIGGR